jgi:Ca2+-binding RTX toxin-like protein
LSTVGDITLATDYDVVISGTFVAADIDSIDDNTDGDITYDGETTADTIDFTDVTANVVINGYDGVDTITGGSGADTINGGLGADTLAGGAGDDTFVFGTRATNGLDTITDFTVADDILDFSAFAAVDSFDEASSGLTVELADAKIINVTDAAADLTDLSNVLTILNAAITTTVDPNVKAVILIGDGNDTNVYFYEEDGTSTAAIETAELTLVGTLSGVTGGASSFASANFTLF